MKTVTKVLVGSRLHGLETPASDYDYRGIHIHPLKAVLSPFQNLKNTNWIEGDVDNTSYELADFCKQATHGNATILEVFFSNKVVDTTPIADHMRENWRKFIDTNKFVMASRGYAQNQLNKMELFDDLGVKGQSRTPKFVVAYCRVLWQCSEFLEDGYFPCQVDEPDLREFLMECRTNWRKELVNDATAWFAELQARITKAWPKAELLTPDIPWIEQFIYEAYVESSNS